MTHINHHRLHRPATQGAKSLANAIDMAGDRESAGGRLWWILVLLSAAQFMLIIDVTVVNVALPSIGKDLDLGRSQLAWIVTAYTLAFGSLLVLGGRLADSFGRRRMFLIGLGLFVLASLGSGFAPDGTTLIATRAFQGVAAAILSPAALSMVTTTFEGPKRNLALAIWAALSGSGAAFGVIMGGALTSGPGWQWIFFINVPVGVVVAIGVLWLVRAAPPALPGTGLALAGGMTFALAVGSLLWGVIDADDNGWSSATTLTRIGAAVLFACLWVWREHSTNEPLVRLEMLADRTFSGAVGIMLGASAILGGMIFLGTLYLQVVTGHSALETGVLFIPMALGLIAGSQWGVLFIGHHGPRGAASAGFLAMGLGVLYLSRLPTSGSVLVDVVPGLAVAAFGAGATLVSATTTAFGGVAEAEAGRASGFVNTAHELGLSLGVALASTQGGASLAMGGGAGGGGYQAAFTTAAAIAVAGLIAGRVLLPAVARHTGDRRLFAH